MSEMVPKLYLACPCYGGGMQWTFAQSMLELRELLVSKRVNHDIRFLAGESLIDRARNNLASDFLKSDATHMMFIDSDIDFDPEDVIKLLVQTETNGYDILGGAYATKAVDFDKLASAARSDQSLTGDQLRRMATRVAIDHLPTVSGVMETENDCIEVAHVATGFMMIRRRVFEELAYARPDLLYLNDHPGENYGQPVFDFFEVRRGGIGFDKTAPHLGRKLSEDYGLCDLWRQNGGRVWLNLDVKLGHTGAMRYEGEAAKIVERVVPEETEWFDVVENPDSLASKLIMERYRWAARYVRSCKVANAACASNYGAIPLEAVGNRVTGFDRDQAALAMALRDGLEPVVLGDIETMNMEGFDAVVSLETLEHLESPFAWLSALAPSVKKLVASVPVVPTMAKNPYHKHDFTVSSFLGSLANTDWVPRETWVQCDDTLMVYAERP